MLTKTAEILIMTKEEIFACAFDALAVLYPTVGCALSYTAPYQLMVATRLSAQCTDVRVNAVTARLFEKFDSPAAFAACTSDKSSMELLSGIVRPCGFYRQKASDIAAACKVLREEYGGDVPRDMDALLALPGVGRKSANLLRGELYGLPAVVVDTHVLRLSRRTGFVSDADDTPPKIEQVILRLFESVKPQEDAADKYDITLRFCHRLVAHGRAVCRARSPACGSCTLAEYCKYCKI